MSGERRRALLGAPKPGSPVAMTCDADAVNEHGSQCSKPAWHLPAPRHGESAPIENPVARDHKALKNHPCDKIARSFYYPRIS
jgi:hypothetical protein